MSDVQHIVKDFVAQFHNVRQIWLGLSGGLDSSVLLHAIAHSQLQVPVRVLHVNHQLSPNAHDWQRHCEQLAAGYSLPWKVEQVRVESSGKGVESAAREARYQVFEKYLQEGDLLLLAHHRDDQAETLLLRMMRGSGVRGLGAMAPVRRLGRGQVGRPLLSLNRTELLAYAEAEQLQWLEDESNRSTKFDRNFLRMEVMPQLARRWPGFTQRWARTAALAREADQLLAHYLAEDLQAAGRRRERLGESLQIEYLTNLPLPRRNALLRHWTEACGYELPDQTHLRETAQLFSSATDAQPQVAWGDCQLRRFANRLYLLPRLSEPLPQPGSQPLHWQPPATVHLPDGARLTATPAQAGLVSGPDYTVTTRRGGERAHPHNRQHSQTLKKLLQEYQLEPWLRDRIPLIYCGDKLAAVGDLWVEKDFWVEQKGAYQLHWQPKDHDVPMPASGQSSGSGKMRNGPDFPSGR